ncbi:hypothetical protein BDK51DRAFT_28896 [Blyttiomyces helicus]|uniref:Uncharacterized protein n=1 Tax=Blyttiomyces helicus TaxID=388810 RepID=A0A4P9WJN7_9FUNG|nr:hypothetical protein BDK51DRAFT_28896 [Blyttiomyces helicus]|eukprot:RKO93159.1 hypothetical protein BDK51DRAFT_28896 [Blyttiomyces helicus]
MESSDGSLRDGLLRRKNFSASSSTPSPSSTTSASSASFASPRKRLSPSEVGVHGASHSPILHTVTREAKPGSAVSAWEFSPSAPERSSQATGSAFTQACAPHLSASQTGRTGAVAVGWGIANKIATSVSAFRETATGLAGRHVLYAEKKATGRKQEEGGGCCGGRSSEVVGGACIAKMEIKGGKVSDGAELKARSVSANQQFDPLPSPSRVTGTTPSQSKMHSCRRVLRLAAVSADDDEEGEGEEAAEEREGDMAADEAEGDGASEEETLAAGAKPVYLGAATGSATQATHTPAERG